MLNLKIGLLLRIISCVFNLVSELLIIEINHLAVKILQINTRVNDQN